MLFIMVYWFIIIIHIFNYSTKLCAFCKTSNKKFMYRLSFKFYVGVFLTRITSFSHFSTNFIISALSILIF